MSGYILPGQAFKQGEVKSGKYDLVYASAGEGPVIVSFPGSAGIEMSVAKDILAREFRVIEINPPGWAGRTDLKEKMDQRDLADLLAEAIAALGIDRYHLLGTSMGGINAVWLTLRHPDRVKSLVLDASMTFMAPEHSTDPAGTGFIEALRAGQFSQQQIEGILANLPAPQYPAKPWQDQAYFRNLMTNRFRMFPLVTNKHEEELNRRASTVKCPVLALIGSADEIVKPSIHAEYEKLMPQAEFNLVPGGFHDLQGSRPEEFARIVAGFVRKVESKA